MCVCVCYFPTPSKLGRVMSVGIGLIFNPETMSIGSYKYNTKEQSFCHKLNFHLYIFVTCWCNFLIIQTLIIRSTRIHSLIYQTSTAMGCKDIGMIRSEFVAKT